MQPSHDGVIVTIARQHGSSGKQIGKLVAERLGIPFYYKEMTALAAQESGLDREFISDLNKKAPQIMHDLYLSNTVVSQAAIAQKKIIERIAENGSCVIVGRAADYVLKDHKNVFRIFVHAPLEYRISRVREVYGDTQKEAVRNISRSDKARAEYYRNISGMPWGEAHTPEEPPPRGEGAGGGADPQYALLKTDFLDKLKPGTTLGFSPLCHLDDYCFKR